MTSRSSGVRFGFGIAGALSVTLTAVHVFGGGPEFHVPMLDGNATDKLKAAFSVIWHEVTAMLVANGVVLMFASRKPENYRGVGWLVLVQYLAFAGLFFAYGFLRLGSPWVLSQWTFFMVISAFIVWGLVRPARALS